MYPYNKELTKYSQDLRKNMTPEEKHLWYDFLKYLPMSVKRQYVVENYILDFFIPRVNIAIEIDGSQHYDPEAKQSDNQRDYELFLLGIKVIRYSNFDVKNNFNGVVADIMKETGLNFCDLKKK